MVAYSIDKKTGELTELNSQPSGGGGPCYMVVDNLGKNVLVANYGGGSVSVIPIQEDGCLGEPSSFIQHRGSSVDKGRQEAPHTHSINLDPSNRFAFAADLGMDKVLIYRFDVNTGKLTPNEVPAVSVSPGSGPRHFTFHPAGKFAYLINELFNTVSVFAFNEQNGALDEVQTITTLPENFKGTSYTSEILVHPSGKFLYGSNRGHNSIAVFSIDKNKGTLAPVEYEPTQGDHPRNFRIDPTGAYLLVGNLGTDTIVVFRIQQKTGELEPTGHVLKTPTPACIKFLPIME